MNSNRRTSSGAPPEGQASGTTAQLRTVVKASMAGTVVEWYEFFLYATASTLVFSKILFPPSSDPYAPILAAFLTYAVGFIARPIGGVVFGHFGDKIGRKRLLQISLVLIGGATFLMGCIPDFNAIGYAAPALLVTLRFVQGFALGGEWGGAVLLVAEHASSERRGYWAAWPQAGVPVGNLLATLVLLLLNGVLSDAQFLAWGWRVSFWLSLVLVAVGYYIRTRVTDAPIFHESKQRMAELKSQSDGTKAALTEYPREVFIAMGLRMAENIFYYVVVTFSLVYLKDVVKMDTGQMLWVLAVANLVHFVVIPRVGALSDRVGRKPVYLVGVAGCIGWGFIAFPLMGSGSLGLVGLAIVLGLVLHAFMYSGQSAFMAEMFPTRMRYSGISLGSQLSSIVAGSLAPFIATKLLSSFDSWVPVALYLVVAGLITGVAVLAARETRGIDLREVDARDHETHAARVGGGALAKGAQANGALAKGAQANGALAKGAQA
ncbi:MHS family MFS transporter [Micrococcales bacterium 31B]|nr:MHS family MFS transporter [Micrococcales bacterium 31B]